MPQFVFHLGKWWTRRQPQYTNESEPDWRNDWVTDWLNFVLDCVVDSPRPAPPLFRYQLAVSFFDYEMLKIY